MELQERVELLERETAALKRRAGGWQLATIGVIGAGLVLSIPFAAPLGAQGARPAVQKEVRTQSLIVLDNKGNPRVTIATDEDNDTTLGILDGNGKVRVSMGTDGKSTSLAVGDSQGKQRVAMVVLQDGTSILTAFDPKGNTRAAFGVNDAANPVLATFDAAGKQTDFIK